MCEYLRTRFQVANTILKSTGGNFITSPPMQNEPLKYPLRLRFKRAVTINLSQGEKLNSSQECF